jgi:hypothetical protein
MVATALCLTDREHSPYKVDVQQPTPRTVHHRVEIVFTIAGIRKISVQRSSARMPGAHFCFAFTPDLLSLHIRHGLILARQQSPSHGEHIRKRRQHAHVVTVLEQPAEANLAKAKQALDRTEDVFDSCAHLRLHSVRLANALIDPAIAPKGLVGQIPCHRRDAR